MDIINLDAVEQEPIQGYTSKGDQPKWQMNGKWYKADHMGYEALAEVLVSQLLKQSNVPNFVEYKPVLIQYQGKEIPGCASKTFGEKMRCWCHLSGYTVPIKVEAWQQRLAR